MPKYGSTHPGPSTHHPVILDWLTQYYTPGLWPSTYILQNVPYVNDIYDTHVIHVLHMQNVMCNTGVYHILHMYDKDKYRWCNTGVYHILHMYDKDKYRWCNTGVYYILHMYDKDKYRWCNTGTCVKHYKVTRCCLPSMMYDQKFLYQH